MLAIVHSYKGQTLLTLNCIPVGMVDMLIKWRLTKILGVQYILKIRININRVNN